MNRNKNWNTTPTDLVLFSVSMLLAPTLWLFVTAPTALGNDRLIDTVNTAALLSSGSHSQHEGKNGRTSMLFPPHFRGWDQWPMENFIPRKSQAGVIRNSNDNSGWRYIILLTSILHSISILYHCPLYHFVSYSKEGKLPIKAKWFYNLHCLFPSLTTGHKRTFFYLQVPVCKWGKCPITSRINWKVYGHCELRKQLAFCMSSVLNISLSSQIGSFQGNKKKKRIWGVNVKEQTKKSDVYFFFQIYIYMYTVTKLQLWSTGLSFHSFINSNSYLDCQDQASIMLITAHSQRNSCSKKHII